MFERLTPGQKQALRDKMSSAYDDISRLIAWAQSTATSINGNELHAMQDMRTEILFTAYEPPERDMLAHDFHDDGTDPGNCRVCHTYHRRPALADGTHAHVPL